MMLDPISVAVGAAVALSCYWLAGEFRARWAARHDDDSYGWIDFGPGGPHHYRDSAEVTMIDSIFRQGEALDALAEVIETEIIDHVAGAPREHISLGATANTEEDPE